MVQFQDPSGRCKPLCALTDFQHSCFTLQGFESLAQTPQAQFRVRMGVQLQPGPGTPCGGTAGLDCKQHSSTPAHRSAPHLSSSLWKHTSLAHMVHLILWWECSVQKTHQGSRALGRPGSSKVLRVQALGDAERGRYAAQGCARLP